MIRTDSHLEGIEYVFVDTLIARFHERDDAVLLLTGTLEERHKFQLILHLILEKIVS